jgi:predicted amidohydrolase
MSDSFVKFAILVTDPSLSIEDNFNIILQLSEVAVQSGCKFICTCECALSGLYYLEKVRTKNMFLNKDSHYIKTIQSFAQKHNIYFILGCALEPGYYPGSNAILVFDDQGNEILDYRKLYQLVCDNIHIVSNTELINKINTYPNSFVTPYGRIGIRICIEMFITQLFHFKDKIDLLYIPLNSLNIINRLHYFNIHKVIQYNAYHIFNDSLNKAWNKPSTTIIATDFHKKCIFYKHIYNPCVVYIDIPLDDNGLFLINN